MDDNFKTLPYGSLGIVSTVFILLSGIFISQPLPAQTTSEQRTSTSAMEANPLAQLEWLIGEWVAKGDGYQARTTSRWSDNRKFIVSQFSVERPGNKPLCGTQRIGWDPAAERIRSWVFDSDGGISEGIWLQEGEAWVVKNVGVLPDGRRSSAANFWVREGNDKYAIKSSHIKVDDDTIADFELEFRRVRGDR